MNDKQKFVLVLGVMILTIASLIAICFNKRDNDFNPQPIVATCINNHYHVKDRYNELFIIYTKDGPLSCRVLNNKPADNKE